MAIQMYHQTTILGWWVQQALDPSHALLVLARQIDWEAITRAWRPYDHKLGQYAKPIRLHVAAEKAPILRVKVPPCQWPDSDT